MGSWLGLKFSIVSRGAGETALTRSIYQAGGAATDPAGIARSRSIAPGEHRGQWLLLAPDAPAWASDLQRLWREAAQAERQWNAQEARMLDVQLPREFPETGIDDLVHAIYGAYAEGGLVVQVDLHVSPARDGRPNPHLHGLISTRVLGPNGFATTKVAARHWNTIFRQDGGRAVRRKVAAAINAVAAKHGSDLRVDPETNNVRGLPAPEPRLPRSVFRKSNTAYAREKLAELDRHRALRGEWSVARHAADRAVAEAATAGNALAAKRASMPCIAPATRMAPNPRLVDQCRGAAELAWINGWKVASVEDYKGIVFINFDQTQIIVEPDKAFVDGRIDEDVGDFIGELVADLGWEQVKVSAANREDEAFLRRSVRRMSRSLDPRRFQIAALQDDPDVVRTLKTWVDRGDVNMAGRRQGDCLDDLGVSSSTRRVMNALRDDIDLDDHACADLAAWEFHRARLEINAVAMRRRARSLERSNQARPGAPQV